MAYQASNWAWELELPMTQKFVLIALADMADESLSCFPGQKRIAQMIGSSERTVRRALLDLETMGLIDRQERRAEDGYRTSDRYVLKTKVTLAKRSPAKMAASPTGQIVPGQSRQSHRPSATVSPAIDDTLTGHSDRAIEPSVNHQRTTSESPDGLFALEQPAEGDLFEQFWSVWPRKDGKKAALESWAKALGTINQHALLVAANAYATSPHRPERKYVPFASTWLNQERWIDPLPVAAEAKKSMVDHGRDVDEELRRRMAAQQAVAS